MRVVIAALLVFAFVWSLIVAGMIAGQVTSDWGRRALFFGLLVYLVGLLAFMASLRRDSSLRRWLSAALFAVVPPVSVLMIFDEASF